MIRTQKLILKTEKFFLFTKNHQLNSRRTIKTYIIKHYTYIQVHVLNQKNQTFFNGIYHLTENFSFNYIKIIKPLCYIYIQVTVCTKSEIFQVLLHGSWHEILPLSLLQSRYVFHHLLIIPAFILNTLVLVPLFKIIYKLYIYNYL